MILQFLSIFDVKVFSNYKVESIHQAINRETSACVQLCKYQLVKSESCGGILIIKMMPLFFKNNKPRYPHSNVLPTTGDLLSSILVAMESYQLAAKQSMGDLLILMLASKSRYTNRSKKC